MNYNIYRNSFIRYFFAILSLYLPLLSHTQSSTTYPQNYFRWPLDLKPEIVANMGELRSNHWHMGLDMRTAQKVNQRVFASAEGYISYVGIRPSSYGRFIKIVHPNGYTTLYGHLNDFNPALEKYVTEQQYKLESWAVELDIPQNLFPVKKGEFIAYSGTTGGSQGPHVHFEIRDTKTDHCLNPLLFGMPLSDNVPPTIVKLGMYDRNYNVYDQSPRILGVKKTDSGYILNNMPVVKTGASKISFSIEAFDRITGSNNRDGVYMEKLFFDGEEQLDFIINNIDYNNTYYINSQIDYKYRENGGSYLQHLSRLPGDNGGVYTIKKSDGVLNLTDTSVHRVKIEVYDAYGNQSVINYAIQYVPALQKAITPKAVQPFIPNNVNVFEKPDFEVFFPEAAIYDTIYPVYYRSNSSLANAITALHTLNDETWPIHGRINVRIKPDKIIEDHLKNRIVIRRTYKGSSSVQKANWQGDWLAASFGDFGSFQAFTDTQAPIVNELGKGDTIDLSPSSRIIFAPTDNFGIKSFRAELDGQWLRFTNDKGRSWIYIFDERCPDGVHTLKVTAEDIAGNVTVKEWIFKKYPYTPPPKKKAPVKKKKVVTKKK